MLEMVLFMLELLLFYIGNSTLQQEPAAKYRKKEKCDHIDGKYILKLPNQWYLYIVILK